jgi:MscS family membrane protein
MPDSDISSFFEKMDFQALWFNNSLTAWGLLAVWILLGLAAGKTTAAMLGRANRRLESRGWTARAQVLSDLMAPISLALLALGLTLGLSGMKMSPAMSAFAQKTCLLLFSIAGFWYAFNLIALVDLIAPRIGKLTDSTLDRQLMPLMRKTLRIFLVVVASLFIVDTVFNQDIGAWLAGLGIAGLAVSLAAQDSLKNLFGSITILLDQPFRVGDRIIYGNYDGVVEEIGFRSTRIRLPSGNLVNVPNSNIVNNPVENVGARPFICRNINLSLSPRTSPEKIQRALQLLRGIMLEDDLREPIHPKIDGQIKQPRVFFSELKPDGPAIAVTYWFAPPDHIAFMEHAEKMNVRILAELSQAGIALSQPPATGGAS